MVPSKLQLIFPSKFPVLGQEDQAKGRKEHLNNTIFHGSSHFYWGALNKSFTPFFSELLLYVTLEDTKLLVKREAIWCACGKQINKSNE